MIEHTVSISSRAAQQLKRGSVWIFSNEISGSIKTIPPGTWCWFESQGRVVGTGYINPHSLIAGRLVSSEKTIKIDSLLSARLLEAFQRRKRSLPRGSMRLVFSESDFLPGLVVDWFSGAVVLQSNTAGMDRVLPMIESLVEPVFEKVFGEPLTAVVVRADSSVRRLEGVENFLRVIKGNESDLKSHWFLEDGLHFKANLIEGQKTGYFLDQRENRVAFETWVRQSNAKSVLDLYSYSGGWGFRALRAGAESVTFVDQSEEALSLLREGVERNAFSAPQIRCVHSDTFDFLHADGNFYDAVVADPPAFVKSKKVFPQAQKAYEKLNRLAWRRVRPGGVLLTSSCSYHMSEQDFVHTLKSAVAKEEGKAHIIHRGLQGLDHPILLNMPETHYLKCLGLQKL